MLAGRGKKLLTAVALGALAIGGCGGQPQEASGRGATVSGERPAAAWAPPKVRLAVRETCLGRLLEKRQEDDWVLGSEVAVSPDRRRLAWRENHFDKERVVVDGAADRFYDNIGDWDPEHLFSPDSSHVAYSAERDGSLFAVIDGKEGPPLDPKSWVDFVFSPDGRRVAYMAERGGRVFVAVDGAAEKAYDLVLDLCFSPDGKRYAYRAERGEKMLIVVDGREGEPHEAFSEPWFSPDGKRVAYGYCDKDGEWFSVVGEVVRGPFECADSHTFSPDGRRVAFVAARQTREVIVMDDGALPLASLDVEEEGTVVAMQFSPDGKRFGYVTARWDGKTMRNVAVIDGVKGKEYGKFWARERWEHPMRDWGFIGHVNWAFFERSERLLFSGDSKHVAYVADNDFMPFGSNVVVVDGKEFGPFDSFLGFKQSSDGRHLAFCGWKDGKATLVLDGVDAGTFSDLKYEFSPDGKHFGYKASPAGDWWQVCMDGKEVPGMGDFWFLPDGRILWAAGTSESDARLILDGKEYPCVGAFHWSPDLKRLARAVSHGAGQHIALDGWENGTYEDVSEVLFSPDGAHVAWFGCRGEKWMAVIDGVEGDPHDAIVTRTARFEYLAPGFDGPSRLRFLARRGEDVYRVEVEIVKAD